MCRLVSKEQIEILQPVTLYKVVRHDPVTGAFTSEYRPSGRSVMYLGKEPIFETEGSFFEYRINEAKKSDAPGIMGYFDKQHAERARLMHSHYREYAVLRMTVPPGSKLLFALQDGVPVMCASVVIPEERLF